MKLLALLELAFTLLFVAFMLTQIIWPLMTKTPVLWLFRKAPQKDIDRLRAEIATEDVKAEADRLRDQFNQQLRRNAEQMRSRTASEVVQEMADDSQSPRPRRRVVVPKCKTRS